MLLRLPRNHPTAHRRLAVQCSGTLADRGARLQPNPVVSHADHALGWPTNFTEQYVRGIQIGKGAYGSVYEATPLHHVGGEAEPVAVKILSKQDGSVKVLRRLAREADALEALVGVPGVVRLLGKYEGPTYAMLVTQLVAGSDLLALRKALGGRLKELQLAFLARQMLTVLAGVHKVGWCHGDCKPANWIARAGLKKRLVLLEQGKLDAAAFQVRAISVLISCCNHDTCFWHMSVVVVVVVVVSFRKSSSPFPTPLQEPWVYAIDFGSASRLPTTTAHLRRRTGTPVYQAPELILRSYDARADVWSAGMVLYQLWSKRLPFWPSITQARRASVDDVHHAVLEV